VLLPRFLPDRRRDILFRKDFPGAILRRLTKTMRPTWTSREGAQIDPCRDKRSIAPLSTYGPGTRIMQGQTATKPQ